MGMTLTIPPTAGFPARLSQRYPRWQPRYYVRGKLSSDPLYPAVAEALRPVAEIPLLDIGCGPGLLAVFLRECGFTMPISGVDYDPSKISLAHQATQGLAHLSFAAGDARQGLPDHRGNVTILDILQFFQPNERTQLLHLAAERVATGGRLVIRTGLRDESWRYRITKCADHGAKLAFWMKAAPIIYPTADEIRSVVEPLGFSCDLQPLWGKTPFNNWLLTFERL